METKEEIKLNRDFPNLQYAEFVLVDQRKDRLAIDDVSFKDGLNKPQFMRLVNLLKQASKGTLSVFEAESLNKPLEKDLTNLLASLKLDRTLLIFPGNGSLVVRDLLPKICSDWQNVSLKTNRYLAENMAVSGIDIFLPNDFTVSTQLQTCVLIDDVIASGATAQAVKETLDPELKRDWYAFSWMSLSPLQSKTRKNPDFYKSSLSDFKRVFTSVVYQGESGIPANNSLSSFADFQKAEQIKNRYMDKYIDDRDLFERVLTELQTMWKEIYG